MCCNTIPRRLMMVLAVFGLIAGLSHLVTDNADAKNEQGKANNAESKTPAALNFKVKSIQGKDVHLGQYHGDVVLVVNVASRCGLTKQYKGLQALHKSYDVAGLSILGFPANNFGGQEPGSDKQISKFCEDKFGVEFDMFSKISVKGKDQADLYKHLTALDTKPKGKGDVSWNFEKFLIGRDGTVAARFSPRTKPDDKKLIKAIEAELAKPVPAAVKAAREKAKKNKDAE